jgi:prepilin-type N-terminal cleavage/methylation domain-containing protein
MAARTRLAGETGMTLIEMVVAMLVLTVGLLGVYRGLTASQDGATAAERSAVLANVGEQALAAVEALNYTNIANSAAPVRTTTSDTSNPTYYLSSCGANTCYQWDPSNSASVETVDVDTANGLVAAGPTTGVVPAPNASGCTPSSTTSGCRITYSIYRFVTNVTDQVCSQSGVTCPTSASYKRVTIAVQNTSGGAPNMPVILSTFVSNKTGGSANPLTKSSTTCLDGTTTVTCTH